MENQKQMSESRRRKKELSVNLGISVTRLNNMRRGGYLENESGIKDYKFVLKQRKKKERAKRQDKHSTSAAIRRSAPPRSKVKGKDNKKLKTER